MMIKTWCTILLASSLLFLGCKNDDDQIPTATEAYLKIKIKFDANQERLDNLGNPAVLPSNHAAQTPNFKLLSPHFIEFVPNELTPYKAGATAYMGTERSADNPNSFGFTTAIDFERARIVDEEGYYLIIPLVNIEPGTYKHLRVSVAYQNYDILFNVNNIPTIGNLEQQAGTIASFVGYNTFIKNLQVDQLTLPVNANKLQGFWAFETKLEAPYSAANQIFSGQAPENATTVVNPFPNNPIPPGSCVVSGSFDQALEITGQEEEDINLVLSFSINNSFEWIDQNANQQWDLDASNPANSEQVVDMGLRGLKAFIE